MTFRFLPQQPIDQLPVAQTIHMCRLEPLYMFSDRGSKRNEHPRPERM